MTLEELKQQFKELDQRSIFDSITVDLNGNDAARSQFEIVSESDGSDAANIPRATRRKSSDFDSGAIKPGFSHGLTPEAIFSFDLGAVDAEAYEPPEIAKINGDSLFTTAATTLPAVFITYSVGKKLWQLHEDYSYVHPDGFTITAPKNYSFDLASVPRAFWIVIAPNELSLVAPLFHDLIYRAAGKLPASQINPPRTFTRREADNLFLEMMEREGVPLWRRRVAYQAVRLFAAYAWRDENAK